MQFISTSAHVRHLKSRALTVIPEACVEARGLPRQLEEGERMGWAIAAAHDQHSHSRPLHLGPYDITNDVDACRRKRSAVQCNYSWALQKSESSIPPTRFRIQSRILRFRRAPAGKV
jgi:hypothetical protein